MGANPRLKNTTWRLAELSGVHIMLALEVGAQRRGRHDWRCGDETLTCRFNPDDGFVWTLTRWDGHQQVITREAAAGLVAREKARRLAALDERVWMDRATWWALGAAVVMVACMVILVEVLS